MNPEEYGLEVDLLVPPERAEARVRELLAEEGFGVLTEIDVKATLRQKLGAEMRAYKILGACNPALAHRALEAEAAVGLLLPCNVVVEEAPHGAKVRLLRPPAVIDADSGPLHDVAQEADAKLRRVAERLEETP